MGTGFPSVPRYEVQTAPKDGRYRYGKVRAAQEVRKVQVRKGTGEPLLHTWKSVVLAQNYRCLGENRCALNGVRLLAWFCVAWAIFGAITTAPPPLHPEIKAADSREGTYRNHNTAEVQAIRTDLGTRCNTVRTWGLYLGTRYSASRCTWAAVHGAHLHRVKRGTRES